MEFIVRLILSFVDAPQLRSVGPLSLERIHYFNRRVPNMPPTILADLCHVDLPHDSLNMFGAMTFLKNQLPLCPYNALTKYAICRIVHMELNGRFKSTTTPGNWHVSRMRPVGQNHE